jgi:hypothetical protein
LLDATVIHHAGEPIARDEEDVTGANLAGVRVGLHLATRADASRDHVTVRVIPRLLGRQVAGVHLLLHVRVVLRDLAQRALA